MYHKILCTTVLEFTRLQLKYIMAQQVVSNASAKANTQQSMCGGDNDLTII